MKSRNIFGRILRVLREQRGLSSYKLAAQSGVARTLITRVETGDREPTDDFIHKVAPVLRVSAVALKAEALEEKYGDDFEKDIVLWLKQRAETEQQRSMVDFWKSLTQSELELEIVRLFCSVGAEDPPPTESMRVEALRFSLGKLGTVIVEANDSQNPLGKRDVLEFDLVGRLVGGDRSFLIAPSGFTKDAASEASKISGMILVDADMLASGSGWVGL